MDIYAEIKRLVRELNNTDEEVSEKVYQDKLLRLVSLLAQLAVPGIRV